MINSPSDLPEPNIPLLRKAVEWAEAEAAKTDGTCLWNQGVWAASTDCGTAHCIAGYVVMAAHPGNVTVAESEYGDLDLYVDGEEALWGETAQELLGLTVHERVDLFDGANTITDVRLFAEQIAARAGERL